MYKQSCLKYNLSCLRYNQPILEFLLDIGHTYQICDFLYKNEDDYVKKILYKNKINDSIAKSLMDTVINRCVYFLFIAIFKFNGKWYSYLFINVIVCTLI